LNEIKESHNYLKEIKQNRTEEMVEDIVKEIAQNFPEYSNEFILDALVLNSNNVFETTEFLKNPLQYSGNLSIFKRFNKVIYLQKKMI